MRSSGWRIVRRGVFLALCVALAGVTWKAVEFRGKLRQITDARQWEAVRRDHQLLRERPVVFFGDSQIAGWPLAPSFGMLPTASRGVSGDWATRALARFDADVLPLQPRIVVIEMGTNDVGNGQPLAAIEASIESMVDHAERRGAKVILCSVLPVRGQLVIDHPPQALTALNVRYRELARRHGADFVDLYARLTGPDGLMAEENTVDGLHPSDVGYYRMAAALYPVVIKRLYGAGEAVAAR
jgi:lysophospholipase L1-like esterase